MKYTLRITLVVLLCAGAHAAEPKDGYFTTVDGVKLHYLTMGEGTPVVLIHGYTGTANGNWFANGVAEALAKNHQVVALDARGHGKSEKPTEPEKYGPWIWQDVIQLMNHLDIEKAHVHGYSMGGYVVTQLLTHYPNRFVSAAYGGSGIPEVKPIWRAKVPEDVKGEDPEEEEAREILRTAVEHHWDALTALRENAPWDGPEAEMIDLSRIDIPVLAINGEYDNPNVKTHRMERELEDFTNVVLPGKSHLTAIMEGFIPDQYIEALVSFINENDPE